MSGRMLLARRTLIASAPGALVFAPWIGRAQAQVAPVARDQTADALFRELDERIEAAMARYHVPGVAVGVFWQGHEHLKGFGVTNVDHPLPVDAETVFRIGSTTKTFTATAMMRLAEQGKVDLAAPARRYLPDLKLADETAASVTIRQLLNHSAGWMGDDYGDFGRGEDAIARYVAGVKQLPQLTPPGEVFAYNNAAVVVAGRVIETLMGKPYETALRELVLEPLGLRHSGFFTDQLVGESIAASHDAKDNHAVVMSGAWAFPRSIDSTGGLISRARAASLCPLPFGRRRRGRRQAGGHAAVAQRHALQSRPRRYHHHGDRRRVPRLLAAAHGRRRASVPARRLVGRAELRLLLRARPAVCDDRADQLDGRPQADGRTRPLGLGAHQVLGPQHPASRAQAAAGGAAQGLRRSLQRLGDPARRAAGQDRRAERRA